jgi:hypothetical protein
MKPSSFIAITSEGGLLPADFLAELLSPKTAIEGLTPQSYNLAEGERISEQVNRSWVRLQGRWADFKKAIASKPPGDPTTTETRERWLYPIFQELGFGQRLQVAQPIEVDGHSYPVSHGWTHVPIHLVGSHADLDRRTPGAVGAAKASPYSLVQQALNASTKHLWGIVSNGFQFRLLRDNVALTRLSYVEWDLAAIFDGDLYSEFFVLWLVCHQSRFEDARTDGGAPSNCWLEKWKKSAEDKGLRALAELRPGVARAIEALGAGLVSHPANQALIARLRSGELSTQDFYRQVLRVIYRMLFLFVAENRELLHPPLPGASASREEIESAHLARRRYRDFYAITRLRGLTLYRAGTPHPDLWHIFQLLTQKLGSTTGCPELALPALGSFLWDAARSTPDLAGTLVSNRQLLTAVHALAFVQDGSVRRPIDYKNLGSEELGSVYEGLLELHPLINADTGVFTLNIAAGNERKTSGSYYTPDSLVQCLLDSALEPVIKERLAEARAKASKSPKAPKDSPSPPSEGGEGRGEVGSYHQLAEKAILSLKVCDKAVGSGHFLIAAAHRIAKHLASIRSGEEEPSPAVYRTALRDVIGHCLYGVDINPMSAELCRVNLWLEALEPGKPLSFLDHHIRVGNSLLGATPELIQGGIPEAAYDAIEGDDKAACAALKKQNKRENPKLGEWFIADEAAIRDKLFQAAAAIDEMSDSRPDDIQRKETAFRTAQSNYDFQKAWDLANLWCAAFVIKKEFPAAVSEIANLKSEVNASLDAQPLATQGGLFGGTEELSKAKDKKTKAPSRASSEIPIGITTQHLRDFVEGGELPDGMRVEAKRLADQYQFFHFHLVFPEVFAQDGFDVSIGNPPWETVKMLDKEWFANRRPDIAEAPNTATRDKLINELQHQDLQLYKEYKAASRHAAGCAHLISSGGAYPLCSGGDLNTFALFAELSRKVVAKTGRLGCVLPTGIVTDDPYKHFFQDVLETKSLISVFDFENQKPHFQAVKRTTKFCLFTAFGKSSKFTCNAPEFLFFGYDLPDLADSDRRFSLSAETIARINPNTKTCPIFRSRRDAALTGNIHDAHHVLVREGVAGGNPWDVDFTTLFHMSGDSKLFHFYDQVPGEDRKLLGGWLVAEGTRWAPLFEQNLFHFFDHRFSTYGRVDGTPSSTESTYLSEKEHQQSTICTVPRYWLRENDLIERWNQKGLRRSWSLAFRQSARTVDSRTGIFCVLPKVASGHSVHISEVQLQDSRMSCARLAEWNSYAWDYLFRQSLGGNNTSFFIVKQVAAIAPAIICDQSGWSRESVLNWLLTRVLELTYTAWDLEAFAQDCGWSGPPFRWDEERRFLLRCELDAAFFHLYLGPDAEWRSQPAALTTAFPTPRDAVAYIMDTFPIVKRKDEAKHAGDYRTKRIILEIYDAFADAMRTGMAYQTRLNPAPASIAIAHLPRFDRERFNYKEPGDYILAFVGSLVRHAGGECDLMKLIRAYAMLLGDRKTFAALAEARFDTTAGSWVKKFNQPVDAAWFLPILRGLDNRDVIKLEERGESDVFVRLLETNVPSNPTVETDVYLLLHVLDLNAAPPAAVAEQVKRIAPKPLRTSLQEAKLAIA